MGKPARRDVRPSDTEANEEDIRMLETAIDPKLMLRRVEATIAEMESRPLHLRARCAKLLEALYAQREQLAQGKRPTSAPQFHS
jgi:hypothetical protein